MSRIYRITIIFIIAAALLGLPLTALAEPAQTLPHMTKNYTAKLGAKDFFKWGVYKVLSEDYRGAIENFTQAIRLSPNDAQAYSNKGLAHAALGDQQGAIEDFNQALRLNSKLATAYYNRGFVRSELQNYQGALEDFNQAIRFNPNDADAYHCRCLVRHVQGDKQGVIEDFQKAAALYLKQGKLEEYEVLLNNIRKLDAPTTFSIS